MPTERQLDVLKKNAFRPGQSGNPAGKPKGVAAKVRELAGTGGERMLEFLLAVMEGAGNASPKDRIEAARLLLAYGFGKPVETSANVNVSESKLDSVFNDMPSEQLEALVGALKAQL